MMKLLLAKKIIKLLPKGKSFLINFVLKFGNKFNGIITLEDGRRFYIGKVLPIYRGLFFTGTYESEVTELIKSKIKEGDYCLDLGANYGYYTTLFSRLVGDSGKVTAFEMSEEAVKNLRQNILENRMTNVVIENKAIGNKNEEVNYFDSEIDHQGSFLNKLSAPTIRKVQMVMLDSYGIDKLDFIKCDLYGSEALFLEGARETLAKFKPQMTIVNYDGVMSELCRYGYKFLKLEGNNVFCY